MKDIIIQLIAAVFGSIGYGILFNILPKRIPFIALGGLLTWSIYLISSYFFEGYILPNLIATVIAGIYVEIFARIIKVPVIVLLLPSIVPLVPGAGLYYTLYNFINKDYTACVDKLFSTFMICIGIAAGMIISSIIGSSIKKPSFIQKKKQL